MTVLTSFAGVSAVQRTAPGCYRAEIDPAWSIGGKPNGGYLLAMLGRAAVDIGPHPHVIGASAHYLRPPEFGPADIEVEVLRGGRSASQLRARLDQQGATCVEALITTAELDPESTPFWDAGLPSSDVAPFDDCVRVPGTTPTGISGTIFEQADVRLDPACLGFAAGAPRNSPSPRGWLALPHSETFDPQSLLSAVDAFPPATFDVQPTGWVPTLELSAYVRALPAPGPVRVLHRAQLVEAQRVDESCYVWDARGRLVAQSTQLAAIKLG